MKTSIILPATLAFAAIFCSCSSDDQDPLAEPMVSSPAPSAQADLILGVDVPTLHPVKPLELPMAMLETLDRVDARLGRSASTPAAYSFSMAESGKTGYAVENLSHTDSWIVMSTADESGESATIIFTHTGVNEFEARSIDGQLLRTFIYNPEEGALWTFNDPRGRALSSSDRFLCNTAFTAGCFLIGEALAVPSGGATLALSLACMVAADYICN